MLKIMNQELRIKKILEVAFILVFCFFPLKIFASVISIEADRINLKTEEEFSVEVVLDTEGENVNAVEGELIFSEDLLELKEIREGNSVINFWVEKPELKDSKTIFFSGITPLGITGKQKNIFSVVFKAKKAGNPSVSLGNLQVLKNNGTGEKTIVKKISLDLNTSKEVFDLTQEVVVDETPPEDFLPQISSDGEIFDGQSFLVFSTQDKGKGIRGYEVREGFFSFFKKADSPYLLRDQSLKKRIYVKAIDMDGNERVVLINKSFDYFNLLYAIIIVMILKISAKFYLRKKYAKK